MGGASERSNPQRGRLLAASHTGCPIPRCAGTSLLRWGSFDGVSGRSSLHRRRLWAALLLAFPVAFPRWGRWISVKLLAISPKDGRGPLIAKSMRSPCNLSLADPPALCYNKMGFGVRTAPLALRFTFRTLTYNVGRGAAGVRRMTCFTPITTGCSCSRC